jgi:hypothetical protein
LRYLQPPSRSEPLVQPQWLSGIAALRGRNLAEILRASSLYRTGNSAGALTVAGQWRNFTAFPSILAISMMSLNRSTKLQSLCHGNNFHDINFYSLIGMRSQRAGSNPRKKRARVTYEPEPTSVPDSTILEIEW